MIALSPSIRPTDHINCPRHLLYKALLQALSLSDSAKKDTSLILSQVAEPSYRSPLSKNVPKCNKSVIALGSKSRPGTRARRRKLCFQVKLVSWHVISWGEFLIHDLMKICQSPSFYHSSHPSTSFSLSAPICFCPCVFLLGYAMLKKVKDSKCGTPLPLNQLPCQCVILPNLNSPPTRSLSLPAALTPSPQPTQFFFSSLYFIPAAL